ncbi:MAG: hypothetical protein QM715_07715 [Nibricoccus sp.]
MKHILTAVLLLSLGANAVLMAKWLRTDSSDTANSSSIRDGRTQATHVRQNATQGPTEVGGKVDTQLWSSLQQSEPKQFLARLTEAGFPYDVARSLVRWRILENFRPRRDAIVAADPIDPLRNGVFSREASKALVAISREQTDALRAALGSDIGLQEDRTVYNRHYYGFLPPEKGAKVASLVAEYDSLRSQVYTEAGNAMLPEDREKLALLEKEMRNDIAAALTPAELELYDLHRSQTAQSLRFTMDLFAPTEAEFRAVFALQNELNQKYGFGTARLDPEQRNQRMKDQQAVNQKIKQALGDARYAEYERGQDFGYRAATQIVQHFNLPAENAVAVHQLRNDYQQKVMSIMKDGTNYPTTESKTEAQNTLIKESAEKLNTLLTPSGAAAYRESAGYWLRPLMISRGR